MRKLRALWAYFKYPNAATACFVMIEFADELTKNDMVNFVEYLNVLIEKGFHKK